MRKWRQQHLIWFGGWERANCKGWKFRIDYFPKMIWMKPFPITILNRLTIYSWGYDFRWWRQHRLGWYVFTLILGRWKFYWSPDGTPGHAASKVYWRRKIAPLLK